MLNIQILPTRINFPKEKDNINFKVTQMSLVGF